jgi:hypothetical protein
MTTTRRGLFTHLLPKGALDLADEVIGSVEAALAGIRGSVLNTPEDAGLALGARKPTKSARFAQHSSQIDATNTQNANHATPAGAGPSNGAGEAIEAGRDRLAARTGEESAAEAQGPSEGEEKEVSQ